MFAEHVNESPNGPLHNQPDRRDVDGTSRNDVYPSFCVYPTGAWVEPGGGTLISCRWDKRDRIQFGEAAWALLRSRPVHKSPAKQRALDASSDCDVSTSRLIGK